ncbi:MAG: hypothetical protein R6U87_08850 [Thiohalospira sp.]
MSDQWRRQRERGNRSLVRFMRWVAARLGRRPARVLLHPITLYFLLTSPAARRASRSYLARIEGGPVSWWAT